MLPELPIIETPQLWLRELTYEQYKQVMHSGTDEELKTFFGYQTDEDLTKEKERHAGGLTMFNKSFVFFHLLEKSSGRVIGWCGYHTWYLTHLRAEIGYTIYDPVHRGKGYMKETLPPVLKYGFEHMHLNRVEAFTAPDNHISMDLLLKNGFEREGVMREHYNAAGTIGDSVVFGLLKRDWKKAQ